MVSTTTLGCAAGPGTVSYGRYQSERYDLAVVGTGAPESAGLMAKGWKLENFYGSPTPDQPKEGEDYRILYHFDTNGDGDSDEKGTDFVFELRFENLNDDAAVWLRVIPVSQDLAQIDLPVLIDRYVESLSGGNSETVWLEEDGRAGVKEKRYASMLLSTQPCRLAQLDCQLATIEIADVDQLKLSPSHRSQKLQVLIARPQFIYDFYGSKFPTYLVAGYANQPGRFDSRLADFHDLLGRIVIQRKKGLKLLPGPSPHGQSPAAPPPAAPNAPAPPPPSVPPPTPAAPQPG